MPLVLDGNGTMTVGNGDITGLSTGALEVGAIGSGVILQTQTAVLNGFVTTTLNGPPDTITNGYQVFSISFTPIRATSLIIVQTSSIAISEENNAADMCWLALWNGSSFVAANSGTWLYNHFTNNYNAAHLNINEQFVAGSTTTRTIQVRAGMNSGSSATYINGNSTSNYNSINAQVRMIVWEIAQ